MTHGTMPARCSGRTAGAQLTATRAAQASAVSGPLLPFTPPVTPKPVRSLPPEFPFGVDQRTSRRTCQLRQNEPGVLSSEGANGVRAVSYGGDDRVVVARSGVRRGGGSPAAWRAGSGGADVAGLSVVAQVRSLGQRLVADCQAVEDLVVQGGGAGVPRAGTGGGALDTAGGCGR